MMKKNLYIMQDLSHLYTIKLMKDRIGTTNRSLGFNQRAEHLGSWTLIWDISKDQNHNSGGRRE